MIIDLKEAETNKLIVNTIKTEAMCNSNKIKVLSLFDKLEVTITKDFMITFRSDGYFYQATGMGAVLLNKLFNYRVYFDPKYNVVKAGFPSKSLDEILHTISHFGIGYCVTKGKNITKSLSTKDYSFNMPVLDVNPPKIDEIDYYDEITYLLDDEILTYKIKPTEYTIVPTGCGTSKSPTGENRTPIPAEDGYLNDNCELAKQSYKKKIGDTIIIKSNNTTYKYKIIGLIKYSIISKKSHNNT